VKTVVVRKVVCCVDAGRVSAETQADRESKNMEIKVSNPFSSLSIVFNQ